MLKLKIILQYKKYILFFLPIILYVFYFGYLFNYHSKYTNEALISGRIIAYNIKKDKATITIKGKEKIVASYYYKNKNEISNIKYGSYIIAKGTMNDPSKNTIPNTFNYKEYLYNHHIYHIFTIKSYKIKQTNNIFYKCKNFIYDRVDNLKSGKYINALVLGNKNYLDEEELISIKSNGIMHLFAVSGMHVSLLVGILDVIFKKLNKYTKYLFIISTVFFYAFLVGFSASILRVGFIYLTTTICDITHIKLSNTKKLLLCFLIMLIINPLCIHDLGFIYSYILVFFIYFYNIKTKNRLIAFLKLSVLTFCISAPITIYNFYEINMLGIIINILFIPLVSYLIFPLSFITIFIPKLDNILYVIFKAFININNCFSKITFLKIIVGKPNLIFIIIFYILVMLIKFNKKYIKYIILIIVLIIIFSKIDSSYRVIYFDVKQGDSSAIIYPNNKKVVLIDTGGIVTFNNKSTYKVSNNIIAYFKSLGINKLDYLILTHGDYDHMGEAINLVENFKVDKVILNCGEINELEQKLIKVLNKMKIKYYSCINKIDNLLFLQTKNYDNENDNSNVIYIKIDGYKFMFMGDAGISKEIDILEKYNISDIDVLKIGHHGSKSSSSILFVNKTNPKYSIISVGKNNRYGHPNKEVLNNLKQSKIYRTDLDGSIIFKINNSLQVDINSP